MKIDLRKHRLRAGRLKKRTDRFLKRMEKLKPRGLDYTVNKLNKEVWKEVDCTKCANCCKSMTPTFTPADVKRISAHLGMKPSAFKEKYTSVDDDNGDLVLSTPFPCPFLGKNDKCTIYEVRPADCAEFPHFNKRQFHNHLEVTGTNLLYCPAALWVVEGMMAKFGEK